MRMLQLLVWALVVALAAGCNRSETDAKAERTAEQVRAAAAKAGHQLADSWLTTKIQAQYFADDDIKARHINVSTRDAVVTLTGYVDGEPQRNLALQIARTTDGVREVNDRLAVRSPSQETGAVATSGAGAGSTTPGPPVTPPAPSTPVQPAQPDTSAPGAGAPAAPGAPTAPGVPAAPDDALLTARVQSRFFVDERIKGKRVEVEAHAGVVTLSGEVADEAERAHALAVARTTEGVVRVEDHLTVAPAAAPAAAAKPATIDDAMLTTMIQARYFVDTVVKESAIDVASKDGVVTLQGSVPSEVARKQALAIAQNAEGVVQVIDRLTIAPPARGTTRSK